MLNDIIKEQQEKAKFILQEQQQPCDKFTPAEISPMTGSGIPHECPKCAGIRRFCSNCHTDHHDGGWTQCRIHTLITSTAQAAYEAAVKDAMNCYSPDDLANDWMDKMKELITPKVTPNDTI